MRLPRFLLKLVEGFEVLDVKEWIQKGYVEIYVKKQASSCFCCRCGHELGASHGKHPLRLKTMPIFNLDAYICLWREKRWCPGCKKVRSEKLDFVSEETPHLTKEYAWWLGRMCEFAPISNAAKFTGNSAMTLWRLDFARLKNMLQRYKIPPIKRISVDEVYARKRRYHRKESRDKRFFTVICDLDTRRVIWVSDSRDKNALDEFFQVIGKDRCRDIEVVAGDQHDPYKASVKEHCPQANFVWDRFHLMQTFEGALNDDRMWLHSKVATGELKRLTRSKFACLFLKKADRRTLEETRHIRDVMRENASFLALEVIKEAMFEVFESKDEHEARERFDQLGSWIAQERLHNLEKWWGNLNGGWEIFKNYFRFRVTSSLSEGMNNVIKTLKKRGYGYRNMTYFKLKILQVCGYLNSNYISMDY